MKTSLSLSFPISGNDTEFVRRQVLFVQMAELFGQKASKGKGKPPPGPPGPPGGKGGGGSGGGNKTTPMQAQVPGDGYANINLNIQVQVPGGAYLNEVV